MNVKCLKCAFVNIFVCLCSAWLLLPLTCANVLYVCVVHGSRGYETLCHPEWEEGRRGGKQPTMPLSKTRPTTSRNPSCPIFPGTPRIHTLIYILAHASTHRCVYTWIHVSAHGYLRTRVRIGACTHGYMCLHLDTYARVYAQVHVRIGACTHRCMYAWIHVSTHICAVCQSDT